MEEIEKMDLSSKKDDNKELVTIKYNDRINNRIIDVEVTKEVAKLLARDDKRIRRKQNQYNYYNLSYDEVFKCEEDENGDEIENPNDYYLQDNSFAIEDEDKVMLELAKLEHQKYLFEQALAILTETQRKYVSCAFYQNMSYKKIAKLYGLKNKSSVSRVIRSAVRKIRNFVENTQI